MPDETIFDPRAPRLDRRRRQKVRLDGGSVWVWESTAADTMLIHERSRRPVVTEGMALYDTGQARVWQIIVSCYDSDQPTARRIFSPEDAGVIQMLRAAEFDRLMLAIDTVNGDTDAEEETLANFTRPDSAAVSET